MDEKADVYSLGCLLYEAVARRPPFAHLLNDPGKSFNVLYRVRPPPPSLSRCATLHIASEPVRALLCPPSAPDAPIIGAGPRVLAHISTHPHSYLCTHAAKLSFAPNAGLI